MYHDEVMDNPNHYLYVVPDDIQLHVRSYLLQAYHDSPLAMHRGREATSESLSLAEHVKTCTQLDTQMSRLHSL